MFIQSEIGLEARVDDLKQCADLDVTPKDVNNVVAILEFARLIRRSTYPEPRISFVHRRFNEYFLAVGMAEKLHPVNLDFIVEDRRDRDALVLFTELCEESEAERIVAFCVVLVNLAIWRLLVGAVRRFLRMAKISLCLVLNV